MARRKKTLPGLNRHPKTGNWHIDKIITGHGRLCRSTGTQDYAEAERRAIKWIKDIEESSIHGKRQRITFSQAAAIYIETETKKSLDDDIRGLEQVMPFIGTRYLDEIHNETLKPMIKAFRAGWHSVATDLKPAEDHKPQKSTTINRKIRVISRILKLACRSWRDEYHRPYIDSHPLLSQLPENDKEITNPLEFSEEEKLLQHLNANYRDWWIFATNTGLRDQAQIAIRWENEVYLPVLNTTAFIIPDPDQKNGLDFLLVLNSTAKAIVEKWRGKSTEWVFPSPTTGNRLSRYNNKHFSNARKAAGLTGKINWHSARATFATRLRAAGVGEEDRGKLLGHESVSTTTQYSWADVKHLIECVERLCDRDKIDQMSSVFRVDSLLKTHRKPANITHK